MLQTPNDVIRRGIALTGINPANEDMPATYLSDGLNILNDILDEWGGAGVYIPYHSSLSFSLTPGKARYTISETISADIQTSEIIQINTATLLSDGQAHVLEELSELQYSQMQTGSQPRCPRGLVLRNYPTFSELIFNSTPDQTYQLTLIVKQRLREVELFQQFDEVPAHYLRALTYQIALDFAAMYGASLSPLIENRAEKLVISLLATNTPDLTLNTKLDILC